LTPTIFALFHIQTTPPQASPHQDQDHLVYQHRSGNTPNKSHILQIRGGEEKEGQTAQRKREERKRGKEGRRTEIVERRQKKEPRQGRGEREENRHYGERNQDSGMEEPIQRNKANRVRGS
jgi:hypothetical protein